MDKGKCYRERSSIQTKYFQTAGAGGPSFPCLTGFHYCFMPMTTVCFQSSFLADNFVLFVILSLVHPFIQCMEGTVGTDTFSFGSQFVVYKEAQKVIMNRITHHLGILHSGLNVVYSMYRIRYVRLHIDIWQPEEKTVIEMAKYLLKAPISIVWWCHGQESAQSGATFNSYSHHAVRVYLLIL